MKERPIRVLMIEDSATQAALFQRELLAVAGGGLAIERVDRMAEGLRRLAAEHFDVVLSDLMLPDTSGVDDVTGALAQSPVPIVLMTGTFEDETLALEAIQKGIQDYVMKSEFAPRRVLRTLRHAVERRQAEDALRASKERFRRIFEDGPLGMAMLGHGLQLLQVNGAVRRLLGYEADALVGRPIGELCHAHDAGPCLAGLGALVTGATSSYAASLRVTHAGGTTVWIDLTANALAAEQGEPVQVLAVLADITARKRAEAALDLKVRELAEANAELEQFNRLAVGREVRMIELKREINELSLQVGRPAPYDLSFVEEHAQ